MTAIATCTNPAHDHTDVSDEDGAETPMTCIDCDRPLHWDEGAGTYVHDDADARCWMIQTDAMGATPCR